MEVHHGQEQQPALEPHLGHEHAVAHQGSHLPMLPMAGTEVPHGVEGLVHGAQHTAAEAAEAAPAAGKRKLEPEDHPVGPYDEPVAKRLHSEQPVEGLPAGEGPAAIADPALAAAIAAATAIHPQAVGGDSSSAGQGGEGDASNPAAVMAQLLQQQQQAGGGMSAALPFDPAAAAALGISPEAQAALQQQLMQFPLLNAEALAAAGGALTTGPDGQPIQLALPILGASGEQMQQMMLGDSSAVGSLPWPLTIADGTTQLTAEQLMQLCNASTMPIVFPLNMGGSSAGVGLPPGMTIGPDGNPVYKNWWDEKDEKELVALVEDPGYRAQKLGAEELDWERIAHHFGGRSTNALRKKYWSLTKKANAGADSDADALELTAVDPSKRPRADRKLWNDEETQELMRLAMEPGYRAQVLHLDESTADAEMWEAISMHFACTVQTAKRKYRHSLEAMQNGTLGMEKGKRQHHRKQTPYRWMIVWALSDLPNQQGTAPDIFERIENNPSYVDQLDVRIMPGTKHVPRWKIQVRKVLSADKIFQHTGLKQKHETVWRLDQRELEEAKASSRNATRNPSVAQAAAAATMPAGQGYDPNTGAYTSTQALTAADLQQLQANGHLAQVAELEQMAMMQQQIAAAIQAAPMALSPEQLAQMSEMQGMQLPPGMDLTTALHHMAAQQGGGTADGTAVGEPADSQHAQHAQHAQHMHAMHQHGDHSQQGVGDHSGGMDVAEGQPSDAHHHHHHLAATGQLPPHLAHMAHLEHMDPATLAALAVATGGDPHAQRGMSGEVAATAGLTLPLVHTVEVPAPLQDDQLGGQ